MILKNLKLVLIYVGNKVPRYAVQNANRLAELFDFEVYLFVDSFGNIPADIGIHARVNLREIAVIETAGEALFGHDAEFRGGFWLHTFNRLLQIKAIHRELGPENPILHIEADMLIMPSFPFEFVLANKLKWFRHNHMSDVASIMYFPNFVETEWMHSQLLKEVSKDSRLTDMSALKKIREKNPSRIDVFPDMFLSEDSEQKVGIFDGYALGIWLCGVDPRNTFGMSIIHENSEYKVEGTNDLGDLIGESDFYLEDEEIKIVRNNVVQVIHCLHIHSKDEKILCSNNSERLKELLKIAKDGKPIVIDFQFEILFKLFHQNLKSKTLFAYLKNLIRFLSKKDKRGISRLLVILNFMLKHRRVK